MKDGISGHSTLRHDPLCHWHAAHRIDHKGTVRGPSREEEEEPRIGAKEKRE